MKTEIVWTAGAERDLVTLFEQVYSRTDGFEAALTALQKPLEEMLALLLGNSKLGTPVQGTRKVRRLLLAPKLRYGLFYVENNRGIMVHALLDMRQDPSAIAKRLESL